MYLIALIFFLVVRRDKATLQTDKKLLRIAESSLDQSKSELHPRTE